MAFEDFKPGTITGYDDLESIALPHDLALQRRLDRVLSPDSYVFDLWTQRIENSVANYGEGLAQLVRSSRVSPERAAAAVYRGLALGRFLVGMLVEGETIDYDPGTLLSHGESMESLRDYLTTATEAYLSPRPTLSHLTMRSIPVICSDSDDYPAARICSTLTLVQAEEYRFNRFVGQLTANLDSELADLTNPPAEPPSA